MPGTQEAEFILILIGLKRYLVKYLYNLIFFIIKPESCQLTTGLRNLGCTIGPVRLDTLTVNTCNWVRPACFHWVRPGFTG